MAKKNFITLVLGVIGGLLFSLGMCMCLLPQWDMFNQGIILGALGTVILLMTWIIYRKLSHKDPIRWNFKVILKVMYGIISCLVFGSGMCLIMVAENMMIQGILVGIIGIVMLLCLIPICLGFKDTKDDLYHKEM